MNKLHANMNGSLQEAQKGTIVISVHAHTVLAAKKQIVSDLPEIFRDGSLFKGNQLFLVKLLCERSFSIFYYNLVPQ